MTTAIKKVLLVAAFAVPTVLLGARHGQAETTGGEVVDDSFAYFIQPKANASYPDAPAWIDVKVGVVKGVEDDGIDVIDLYLDDVLIDSAPCAQGCSFAPFEVGQGVHELSIRGNRRTIYVGVEAPEPGETGEDEETGDDGGGGGGGCQIAAPGRTPWGGLLGLPVLLLIPGFRRARRG